MIGRLLLLQSLDQEEDFTSLSSSLGQQRSASPDHRKEKMVDSATVKTSWADDVEVEELELPKVEDYVDENGIRITTEYTINDEGKKVKVWCCF